MPPRLSPQGRLRRRGRGSRLHAAPVRRRRAGDPGGSGPASRGAGHGRQRAVGRRSAGCRAPRGTRPARRACSTRPRGHRAGDRLDLGVRVLHRELAPLPGRGAVPDGLQPRRDPPPSRRDARAGRTGPLGRPAAAAVAVGDRRAGGRRGADPRQRRADPDDVRQLRRPGRDRRRRAGDRPRGRRRPPRSRTRSTSRRSPATSTSPTCPTSTCSCAPPGSSGRRNFLLWQSAYAELVFVDTLWPDFDRRHLWGACEQYASRDRRYGGAVPGEAPGRGPA